MRDPRQSHNQGLGKWVDAGLAAQDLETKHGVETDATRTSHILLLYTDWSLLHSLKMIPGTNQVVLVDNFVEDFAQTTSDVLQKILRDIDRLELRHLLQIVHTQHEKMLPTTLIYPGRVIAVQGKLQVTNNEGNECVELMDTPQARLILTLTKPGELLKMKTLLKAKHRLTVVGIVENIEQPTLKVAMILAEQPELVGAPRQLDKEDAAKIDRDYIVEA